MEMCGSFLVLCASIKRHGHPRARLLEASSKCFVVHSLRKSLPSDAFGDGLCLFRRPDMAPKNGAAPVAGISNAQSHQVVS